MDATQRHLVPVRDAGRGPLGRPRTAALLDVDADLGAQLDDKRFEVARRVLAVRVVDLSRGAWTAGDLASFEPHGLGLLVLEGVIAWEVVLADTVSTELLGPGDLIRPQDACTPSLLGERSRFQVLADARLGVLGARLAGTLPHFPEVNSALLERASARAQRLATMRAISHVNSVERRLLMLVWHLAERWGRVGTDGVLVPLALSHRLLGELVGARRPTVTTALAALEREGSLRRLDNATWLLTGEPEGKPEHRLDRIVLHRRRLLR